jgi:hypothetical protein
MSKYEGQDYYLDPETGVLNNKLGIGGEEELNKAEASFTVRGAAYAPGLRRIAGMPWRRAAVAAAAIRVLMVVTDSTRYRYPASMLVRQSVP